MNEIHQHRVEHLDCRNAAVTTAEARLLAWWCLPGRLLEHVLTVQLGEFRMPVAEIVGRPLPAGTDGTELSAAVHVRHVGDVTSVTSVTSVASVASVASVTSVRHVGDAPTGSPMRPAGALSESAADAQGENAATGSPNRQAAALSENAAISELRLPGAAQAENAAISELRLPGAADGEAVMLSAFAVCGYLETLQQLDLGANPRLTDVGVLALAAAMEDGALPALARLDMKSKVSHGALLALRGALRKDRRLLWVRREAGAKRSASKRPAREKKATGDGSSRSSNVAPAAVPPTLFDVRRGS